MSRFFPRLREPFLSLSHLLGGVMGLAGTILLLFRCDFSAEQSYIIALYGLTFVLLFGASSALHGRNHRNEREVALFERFDYAAIYLFIAGTYTPVCLLVLSPGLGVPLLAVQWAAAIAGCWSVFRRGPGRSFFQVMIFLVMGWGFLFAFNSLFCALSEQNGICLMTGAVAYSVGAVIFAFAPPVILRGTISSHAVWHLLVLVGASAHFVMIDGIVRGV